MRPKGLPSLQCYFPDLKLLLDEMPIGSVPFGPHFDGATMQSERRITRAGRKIRAHLVARGESLYSFCRRHPSLRDHRVAVLRIVNGARYRLIPADTIIRLKKAMERDGACLKLEDFASATARKTG